MSHNSKTYTHVKQTASYTREDHGQPLAFVTVYEWCDPGEEGSMLVSEMPEDDYDEGGGGLGTFRHYPHEITNEDRDFSNLDEVADPPITVEIVRNMSGVIDVRIKGYGSMCLRPNESKAVYRITTTIASLVQVDVPEVLRHSDKITVVEEPRIDCIVCNEEKSYESGYGCHHCDADVCNNELVQVETPQGLQWYEKDDPVIPLFKRWSAGEIPTYVLDQEILTLYQ